MRERESPELDPAITMFSCQEGWEYLLGPLTGTSLLCLANGGPAVVSLAQRCDRLCVLTATKGAAQSLREWVSLQGWRHVDVMTLDPGRPLALVAESFDGLVMSDLSGRVHAHYQGGIQAALDATRPLLRKSAFILLAGPNRWGLSRQRLQQRFKKTDTWTWYTLLAQMHKLGVKAPTIQPMLLNDHISVQEAIAPHGFIITKNAGKFRERIKTWLWGPRGARWFAPALGAIGWLGQPQVNVIDSIGAQLQPAGAGFFWVQYLVLLSSKVIATFVSKSEPETARVVVVTRDPLAIARRTREAQSLRQLICDLPQPLADLLPKVLDRFTVDGNECFVLERVRGVTADAVVPGLKQVTQTAQRFLLALHVATRVVRIMDQSLWATSLGPIFKAAAQRNPEMENELLRLEQDVRDRLWGQPWLEVCSHGDFKIENVMYDPHSFEITGVIDWEHAMLAGIPYIDLAYLLTYNRMLKNESWLKASRSLLLGQIDEGEAVIENDFWHSSSIPAHLVPVLRALVIVHHIGCRWHGQWSVPMREELRALLEACRDVLRSGTTPAQHFNLPHPA